MLVVLFVLSCGMPIIFFWGWRQECICTLPILTNLNLLRFLPKTCASCARSKKSCAKTKAMTELLVGTHTTVHRLKAIIEKYNGKIISRDSKKIYFKIKYFRPCLLCLHLDSEHRLKLCAVSSQRIFTAYHHTSSVP